VRRQKASPRGISHAAARRLGWTRVDARPWHKCHALWLHRDGWILEHCGHPTANWPWMLCAPDGSQHRTGAPDGNPNLGSCWRLLGDAMRYVATQPAWPHPPEPTEPPTGRRFTATVDGVQLELCAVSERTVAGETFVVAVIV